MMFWIIGGTVFVLIAWFGWELHRAPTQEDYDE